MKRPSQRHRTAPERRESIIVALRAEGFLSIADLTRDLGVSHMTVRRDLQRLEQTGQVRMVYGGVGLSLPALQDAGRWVDSAAGEEARIGRCATTLIDETSTVAIDAGQLGYEVARALPEHFRGTVVTHSIPVIQLLTSRPRPPRLVGLGGELLPRSYAFGGASTVAAIDGVRVDTLFLAIDGLDGRGAYAHSDGEASVKRALLGVARRTVLVARHACFDDSAPLLLGRLSRFTALVTDRRPPTRMERALLQAGVDVLVTGDTEPAARTNGIKQQPSSIASNGFLRATSTVEAAS
ncbi:MAG TPA: DeoR/GlpR family DNA-binding transcription regulator [Actinoplanes sp.]